MRRRSVDWMPHRAAYMPRTWPWIVLTVGCVVPLAGGVAALLTTLWGDTGAVIGVIFGLGIGSYSGAGVVGWRWDKWRRENPVLPRREWRDEPS